LRLLVADSEARSSSEPAPRLKLTAPQTTLSRTTCRHRSSSGEPFLLPPDRIRRVVICTGQIYYHLSK